ncbi:MAG: hypothetical protein RLZ22_1202, partial [Verrucomicrobiota bacterium]
ILLLPFPIGFFYTSLTSLSRMLWSEPAQTATEVAKRK